MNHGFLNDDAEYRLSQKAAHWATVGLLTAAYGMVWVREALEAPGLRTLLLQYHRSIGLLMVSRPSCASLSGIEEYGGKRGIGGIQLKIHLQLQSVSFP